MFKWVCVCVCVCVCVVQYDLSASTFSPDGRVFQVEYAMKAVENSRWAVNILLRMWKLLVFSYTVWLHLNALLWQTVSNSVCVYVCAAQP